MSTGQELESRVERLETTLRDIDARLAKLEHRAAGSRPPTPAQPAPETPTADGNVLGLAGICSLILGGAFVLRAMTESQMLPRLGGAILGLAYAGFWIWNADRLARTRRPRAALFYAMTAAVIAFPLVWEATVRFHIVPAAVAAIVVGILGLIFLWIAVRSHQQLLAWSGSIAAIVAAFAVGPSAAMLISITAIGAATAIAARQWYFAAWPAALVSNILALIVIVMHPPVAVIALLGYSALWTACAVVERQRHDITLAVQATIAIIAGVGGATFLVMPDIDNLSLIWCAAGLATAVLAWRMSSRTIAVQSVIWIVAAAIAGGLVVSTGFSFIGEGRSIVVPPPALAAGITALIAYVLMLPSVRAGVSRPWGAERMFLLSLFLCMAFAGLVSILAPMVTNAALLRTALLAVAASLLAVIGRLTGNREASILARAVLVVGGLKLIAEDLRVGSAAILVIAFALYGAALMVVSRSGWARDATAG